MSTNPKIAALLAKARANAQKGAASVSSAPEVSVAGNAGSVDTSSAASVPAVTSVGSTAVVAAASQAVVVAPQESASPPVAAQSEELSPQQYLVVEKIAMLQQMLLAEDPSTPILLKQIHTALTKDPELVYLLNPQQVGAIVGGCKWQTKVVIVTDAVKKTKTTAGKKLAVMTLADI